LIVLTTILFFIEFGIVYGYGSPPMNATEKAIEEANRILAGHSNLTIDEILEEADRRTAGASNATLTQQKQR
jgi:hypothetical protein